MKAQKVSNHSEGSNSSVTGASALASASATASAAAAANLLANIGTQICSMKLIQLVRRNEILYNNQADGFMDKTLKLEVWHRLERQLLPKYDCLNEKGKEIVHGHVKRRWKTLRNTIAREVKKNSSLENFVRKKESPIIAELEFLIPHIKSAHCAKLSDELGLRENYAFMTDNNIATLQNDEEAMSEIPGVNEMKQFMKLTNAHNNPRRQTFDLTMEDDDDGNGDADIDDDDDLDDDDDDDNDVDNDNGHGDGDGVVNKNDIRSGGGGSDLDNTLPQAFYPTVQLHTTNLSGNHGILHHSSGSKRSHQQALNGNSSVAVDGNTGVGAANSDDDDNDTLPATIAPSVARKKWRRRCDLEHQQSHHHNSSSAVATATAAATSAIATHTSLSNSIRSLVQLQSRLLQLVDGMEQQRNEYYRSMNAINEQDNNDADRMFLLALVSDLKRISPAKKMQVKAEIAALLARAMQ